MKKPILSIILLFSIALFSQQFNSLSVEYTFSKKMNSGYVIEYPANLTYISGDFLYVNFESRIGYSREELLKQAETGECPECGTNKPIIMKGVDQYLYKNKEQDYYRFPYRNYEIKDTIVMDWNLIQKKDTILGYVCNAAETVFRGRKYTAFYTVELPISLGPWKFNGLPGLILKVVTNNDDFTFEANSIELNPEKINEINSTIKTLFSNSTVITFDEYSKILVTTYKNKTKSRKSSNEDPNVTITSTPPNTLECIYKDVYDE